MKIYYPPECYKPYKTCQRQGFPWHFLSCMDKNKKEKIPWLKSQKKTGPKKKKVFDEG